ncbi:MAG: dethiobiotin synthase [Methylococcaceae bacterium]
MHSAYFITGTDTDVGKTWATLSLMHAIKQQGKSVIGMKPVAAGCELLANGSLRNADALLLQTHSSVLVDYALINPYAYQLPLSPHLAGATNPVNLSFVQQRFKQLQDLAQVVLVEGAGGWYSPVNATQANSDLAQQLGLPIILVVGIKLGCINHARLSYQAISSSGLHCSGWIAVCIDESTLRNDDIIKTIQKQLTSPLLGILPYDKNADFAGFARYLNL